ncbi:MAG: adenylosuccinate synthase, partial [Flavobacteriaceae bacterium]|nr:adenylosuccinate synthase [Flavobacteriaceae bacterium]
SGIFREGVTNLVGNGVVIDPVILKRELENLTKNNIDFTQRMLISRKAHLILPTHRLLDAASETAKGKAKIGSTLKGIGPTYMDKTGRNGLRVGDLEAKDWKDKYRNLADKHQALLNFHNVEIQYDLAELEKDFFEAIEILKTIPFIDSEQFLFNAVNKNQTILAEGAQGTLLDIDFGTYPYVTSSNTSAAGACTGLGVAPGKIKDVLGIFKAYTTRVGSGPFPTELFDETGALIAKNGHEFGATTGRPRRCGWLDLVALKYAIQINGVTKLYMMKSDVLSGLKQVKVCTHYKIDGKAIYHWPYSVESKTLEPQYKVLEGWTEDLTKCRKLEDFPPAFLNYIRFLEDELQVPIVMISIGPDRLETVFKPEFIEA